MSARLSSSTGAAVFDGGSPSRPQTTRVTRFECYCGLGPACPLFRQMTPEQRSQCSQDKRQTEQYYWKNGM